MMIFYDDSQRSSDDPKSEHLPWCSGLADLMTRWRTADAGQVSRASFVELMYTLAFHTNFLPLGHRFHFLVMTCFDVRDCCFVVPDVGSRGLEHALAHGNADVATALRDDVVVLFPIECCDTFNYSSPHNITTPRWKKPTGHWKPPNLGSLTITHPIATSSLQPSIN